MELQSLLTPPRPACYDWEITTAVYYDSPLVTLHQWYRGICCFCGKQKNGLRDLCFDHDHQTGLVRGRLCKSCNAREGKHKQKEFQLYYDQNPCLMLGLEILYVGPDMIRLFNRDLVNAKEAVR